MADEDVKTYFRGGELVFVPEHLKYHVGEICTLSFWIRLGEGAVEGHSVVVYPYQDTGIALCADMLPDNPTSRMQNITVTADWTLVEYTGLVVNLTPEYTWPDGSSSHYYRREDGQYRSYGIMYFYDRTGSQKYDVYGISLTLHGSGGGASMTSNGRNLLLGSGDFTATGSAWNVAGPTSDGASWNIPATWTKEEDGEGTYSLTKYNGSGWGGFGPRVGMSEGDIVTVSFDLKASANAQVVSVHRNVKLGNVTTGLRIIGASDNCPEWHEAYCRFKTSGAEMPEWTRFWLTIQATEDVVLQTRIEAQWACDYIGLRRFKWEFGTTATPWRPAPEDTEQPSDLVYAGEGVDLGDTSSLATDADARGYASDAQAAATAAAAADATGKANAAQAAAISAAAADATSKANAAQNAAEATAAADATSKANAAQAAANGYADAQVATRARTFATGWTYALTADAEVDGSKTYYTRSGSGTEQDPYVYTEVASPTAAGLPTYYEMVPETPAPPYSQGDMWLQGDGGAILVCIAAKAAGGAYAAEDWEPASGYTDDAAADALSSGMAALADADAGLAARMDTADAANQAAMAEMDARVASAEGTAAGVSARLVSLEDYVRVVGGDHLELGKAGSAVTASLENDRLAFLLVGQDAPVAYIAADEDGTGKLFVTQAVVVSELQFGHGNWAWTERKNGNMALKWRGGEA